MRNLLLLLAAVAAITLTSAQAQDAAEPAAAVVHKTLWEQLKEGGWVMVPIGFLSVFTVYLIGDGVLRTSQKKIAPPQHAEAIKGFFRAGDYVSAYNYCKENPCPLTNILGAGIGLLGEGKQIAEEAMLTAISKENGKLNIWISYLSVIGVCAPMIGLLGTVTGMIRAFATLGSSGIGDPSSLSAAIGEVLVATASGLFIAIPAFGTYYYLRNRSATAIHDIQDTIASLFRKMPYALMAGVHIGGEEVFAADPYWVAAQQSPATESEPVAQ